MKTILLTLAVFLYHTISAQTITIPYDNKQVTVDGMMTATEWTGASKLAIKVSATDSIVVFYKHDMNALYLAYTGKLESANALFPEVLIDPQMAKGNSWQNGQWWFHVSATDCENNGGYGVYNNCKAVQPDWEGANNFVQGAPSTDTVEVKIPFSKIGFNANTQNEMGIAFLVTNTATIWKLWPATADKLMPVTWSIATINKFPVAAGDVEIPIQVRIYPNPAATTIAIEGCKDNSQIKIADLTGQIVLNRSYERGKPVNIAALPSGTYIVQVYSQDKLVARQLVQKQ